MKPDSTAKSTHSIRWSLISVILAMSAFAMLVGLKETIAQAHDNRLQLTLLSEELRQTSDDLTRMVRTYVATGDRQYRQYFDEILAIRNGLSPRPQGINRIYWDLVSKDEERPLPFGEKLAFLELLKEQGVRPEELAVLEAAKASSDKLTELEYRAMKLVESNGFSDSSRLQASQMLHGDAYHQAKRNIMRGVSDFQALVDNKSLRELESAYAQSQVAMYAIVILTLLAIYFFHKEFQSKRLLVKELDQMVDVREQELAVAEKLAVDLQEASEEKNRFLRNMSHELRTPMHAILSFSSLGISRSRDEKARKYFSNIQASGERLTRLLDDLLDLSKLESKRFVAEFEATDLCGLVSSIVDEVSALASEKHIRIDYPDNQRCMLCLDKSLIARVLVNLLANAIRYSPEHSAIRIILVSTQRGTRVVSVVDEGIGIPKDEQEKVFDSFVQGSKTRSQSGGTGLGLTLSKEIVELHDGRIWIESPPLGEEKGTAVSFELPVDRSECGA